MRKKKIQQLSRQVAMKAEKNVVLDKQIQKMQVTVAEIRHIYQATGNKTVLIQHIGQGVFFSFWLIMWLFWCLASEENQVAKTEERYQEILQRRKLKDIARAQAEELAFLRAEVERLRMKNFPSLDQLKHN